MLRMAGMTHGHPGNPTILGILILTSEMSTDGNQPISLLTNLAPSTNQWYDECFVTELSHVGKARQP